MTQTEAPREWSAEPELLLGVEPAAHTVKKQFERVSEEE